MSRSVTIRDPQGMLLGLIFLAVGATVFVIGSGYRLGAATDMGPGYFPRLLGAALSLVGILVAAAALRVEGPAVSWRSSLRPVPVVLVSILAFAALLRPLGAVLAIAVQVLIASLASSESRWRETVLSAVAIAVFCALVFVKGLGMQVPLWPWSPV